MTLGSLSPYHNNVAVRKETKTKSPGKKKKTGSKGKPWGAAVFWVVFFVLVSGLFLINREKIHDSIESVRCQMDSRSGRQDAADGREGKGDPEPAAPEPAVQDEPARPPEPQRPAPQAPEAAQGPASQSQPAAVQPPQAAPPPQAGEPPPVAQPAAPAAGPVTPAPETRERALYFTQVDREGTILRIKVSRKLPVSDSPMVDSIRALINGPDTDEARRGLISLIPKETSVLNATVRGSTAYISLSEDFQFNTHGVEGYAASLRQIIWTVTEFPNVKDVQILIEGRPLDYLGEGIWIGSPLDRDTVP